jgi:hypothetical protein
VNALQAVVVDALSLPFVLMGSDQPLNAKVLSFVFNN